ncbi:MAG TPA: hypothetical protein PLR32_03580 [candidate division Zixibacteria bacterium]|nr:hypothetical protein [candidate division Zixibacteria bacterium]MDD4916415.1 hypothetical protein [candidate division Zixibacteria bacterium]MDM7972554.1 hypothetical protein [candidate division Zixibacteria bacterium]HOZ07036.1 hypothetical protein [candidate division Zixibacteria bacterium]HPI32372.1 hypothetical protein [candidate division Zixibacteria bacterium]
MTTTATTSKQSRLERLDRFESKRFPTAVSEESAVVRAASLLLGVEIRGWLSRSEQEYLDSLAPDNALTFLVRGDRYLHPEEVPLFPPDLIDAAVRQGRDAVFSHRCAAGAASGPGISRVFTGVIEDRNGAPLVLGMLCPDSLTDKVVLERCFERVISAFRSARDSVRGMLAALGPTPPGAARILVNRASGRVFHADPDICTAAACEPSALVAREYGTVEPLVRRLVARFKMKLENHACGCLHVACLTFEPAREAAAETRLSLACVDSLRRDAAGLTTAAEYIAGNSGLLAAGEIQALASEIARTGRSLSRRLARTSLVARYGQMEPARVNLAHQIDHAIDRFAGLDRERISLVLDGGGEQFWVSAPPEALLVLFETVLEAHAAADRAAATAVRVDCADGAPEARVVFTTIVSDAARIADLERAWPADADRLVRRLGAAVERRVDAPSRSLTTAVTFRTQEIPA